jgi:hypothetical protein
VPLASQAEELAAWAIIHKSKVFLDAVEGGAEVENPFSVFIDGYFEDTDLLFLIYNTFDGIDEAQAAQVLGISSLAFNDWFQPFSDGPYRIPHPYVI